MNAKEYEKLVSVGVLRRLAEAEANLIASAEERAVSAERIHNSIRGGLVDEESKAFAEAERSNIMAAAMRAEAEGIRKRAITYLVEEVEKQKDTSADDLVATLEHAFKDAKLEKFASDRLSLVKKKIEFRDYTTAYAILTEDPWPTGVRQAYLDLVVEELLRKMMEEKHY